MIVTVLRYVKYAWDYSLHYIRYPAVFEGYNDVNWTSNIKDLKFTNEYVFILVRVVVSWKPSMQIVIVRSTIESKFIALTKCGEEAEWFCHFLEDILKQIGATNIYWL